MAPFGFAMHGSSPLRPDVKAMVLPDATNC
jgi:hypothetical protein